MARTKKPAATSSWRVGKRSGLYKATFSITVEQLDALNEEAVRRRPPGAIRADASAVVREVLDAWLARRR